MIPSLRRLNVKSKKNIEVVNEQIIPSGMTDVLIGAFNRYAKAVITDRSIPDVRDGLKPVQRRIIYDMFEQGYLFTKPTVKCATIVGHVMGHFHPHGDASIYDALVHLSQNWKMEAPLIDFQGNNGSIDDDGAAANRYTEARLSALSEYLVKDIQKKTVDMVPTFDDKSLEPTVLPARFPNILVNGTSGIAVGSTTYITPHNLEEVINAVIYRIQHKRANLDDLLNFIKGPDFPTGGIIDDKQALRKIYETGTGSFYLYAKAEINHDDNTIVISEIPFGAIKKLFVTDLVKRKENDNLDNIEEIIDESSKDDVNIVIQIKKGASPEDVLNYLQSKGALRNTISCNFLAINKGHPKTMSLLEIVDAYIDHQRDVETKAFQYDLRTALDRLEIVSGLMKAYPIVDEIIEKIKKSSGKEGVKKMLRDDYGFTERQAEAIAMMPLYRLSKPDIEALRAELDSLNANIAHIKEVLSDSDKLDKVISNNLKEICKKFAAPRKTQILDSKLSFDNVDQTRLIAKEDCYVAITADGYAKRSSVKSYTSSGDANSDDPLNLPKLKPGDKLVFKQKCSTHDSVLFFTDKGNYGFIPIYQLSDMKWREEGKHLNNLITLKSNEKIVKCFMLDEFKPGYNIVILTLLNKIKRTALTEFKQTSLTKRPLRACKLMNDEDRVVAVEMTSGNSDIVVVDELGRASRYNEGDIPLVSLTAMGVKAIASGVDETHLVSLITFTSKEASLLLILADKGAARLIHSSEINTTERLGPKSNLIKIFKKNPMLIKTVTKVEKIRGQKNLVAITTNESTCCLDLGNLSPIELGSELRVNIPNLGKQRVIGFNDYGFVMTPEFKPETPKPSKINTIKASPDKADTQLSLFDLFEKENNKH